MEKYLSFIFLYNRACFKKNLLIIGAIPLCFLAIFLWKIGNPAETSSYMLMERAFDGVWGVLVFVAVNLMGLVCVANALNGGKAMKATHATTGYTIRRLRLSPISSCFAIFFYYLVLILLFWGVAIASLYVIGKVGLTIAGATDVNIKLAMGLLRTDIGHALIPIANPTLILFNFVVVLGLAGECTKSCYLSWHNGRPSAGVILVLIPMFLIWTNALEEVYIFMTILIIGFYTVISLGDVLFREKHPKGDPFKANQYAGIMDLDSFEFDQSGHVGEANRPVGLDDPSANETSILQRYGRAVEHGEGKKSKRMNLIQLRRRFMPLGINMERANALFGGCIFIGIAEHLIFFFQYLMALNKIQSSIKGITIVSGVKMPYFWDLEAHTYYGYIIAILMVLFLQAYWNYEYYNKKTKSVYVMRRLPDRREYPKTIWVAPIMQALFIAMIAVIHTAIDFCVYVLSTPEIALHADYLSHILPF